jgi:hypothetical protein
MDHGEAGLGEGQIRDVSLAYGDPVVQSHESIEPTGCFAVLLGQVDGGDAAAVMVGEEAGGSADPATGVEHLSLTCDLGQFGQLAGGDSTQGVEVLEYAKVSGL